MRNREVGPRVKPLVHTTNETQFKDTMISLEKSMPRGRCRLRRASAAFTVAEVILVLALLVVISVLVIMNFPRVAEGMGAKSVFQTMDEAVRDGHRWARSYNMEVYLAYDEDGKALRLWTADGRRSRSYPLDQELERIRFRRILPEERLSGAYTFNPDEDYEIDRVWFHPGGGATFFEVSIVHGVRERNLVYDPFSGARMELERIAG